MKCLGILGGMSWESTLLYYRGLNQGVSRRLGGLHSARLVLHSVDFAPVAALQAAGDWSGAADLLADAAGGLRLAGAQGLVLATNTMHKVADLIEARSGLTLLHIADATGEAARRAGHHHVGLLGTRYTMEDAGIVADRLRERHGLRVSVPDAPGREAMHRVIYDELCRGVVDDGSRRACVGLIDDLRARGADAVVLGCTEITLLIGPGDSPLPLLDSTALHVEAALSWMIDAAIGDPR